MARRGDRTCFVCGNSYRYCPTCGGDDPKETWRFLYCSENCHEIEHIWEDCFRDKNCSTEDAAIRLMDCDISRLEFYRDQIRDDITSIAKMAELVEADSEDEESEIEEIEDTEEFEYDEDSEEYEDDEDSEDYEESEEYEDDESDESETWE